MLGYHVQAFLVALGLLSRIPVPERFYNTKLDTDKVAGLSVIYYPLVGLLIGAVLALSWYSVPSSFFVQAPSVVSVVTLTLWVVLTGGIHLDGLADSADAWIGGMGDKDKTLAIMKDPYSGPFAVIAIVLVLLMKFSILSVLPSVLSSTSFSYLIFIPAASRLLLAWLFVTTPYVNKTGMGYTAKQYSNKTGVVIVTIVSLVCAGLIYDSLAGILLVSMVLLLIFLRYLMLKRVGGFNGDLAGASVELLEVFALLLLLMLSL